MLINFIALYIVVGIRIIITIPSSRASLHIDIFIFSPIYCHARVPTYLPVDSISFRYKSIHDRLPPFQSITLYTYGRL